MTIYRIFKKSGIYSFLLHVITKSNFKNYITYKRQNFEKFLKAFKGFKNCISIVSCPHKKIEKMYLYKILHASIWIFQMTLYPLQFGKIFHDLCKVYDLSFLLSYSNKIGQKVKVFKIFNTNIYQDFAE